VAACAIDGTGNASCGAQVLGFNMDEADLAQFPAPTNLLRANDLLTTVVSIGMAIDIRARSKECGRSRVPSTYCPPVRVQVIFVFPVSRLQNFTLEQGSGLRRRAQSGRPYLENAHLAADAFCLGLR